MFNPQSAAFTQADTAYQSRTASKSKSASSSNVQQTRHKGRGHTRRCPQRRQTMWHGGGGGGFRLHQEAMRRRWDAWGWLEFRQTGWEDSWTDRHVLTTEQTVPRDVHHPFTHVHIHTCSFGLVQMRWTVYTQKDYIFSSFRWLLTSPALQVIGLIAPDWGHISSRAIQTLDLMSGEVAALAPEDLWQW